MNRRNAPELLTVYTQFIDKSSYLSLDFGADRLDYTGIDVKIDSPPPPVPAHFQDCTFQQIERSGSKQTLYPSCQLSLDLLPRY